MWYFKSVHFVLISCFPHLQARIDVLIQDAMLRFMIQLFNQYRMCLIPPTSLTIDHNECFNRKGLIRHIIRSLEFGVINCKRICSFEIFMESL